MDTTPIYSDLINEFRNRDDDHRAEVTADPDDALDDPVAVEMDSAGDPLREAAPGERSSAEVP